MPEPRVVSYKDDEYDVTFEVVQSDGRRGMYRSLLRDEAISDLVKSRPDPVEGEIPAPISEDDNMWNMSDELLHVHFYPCMIAGTRQATGFSHWPITYVEYALLPEGMLIAWEEAIFGLNPQWKLKPDLDDNKDLKKSTKPKRSKTTRGSRHSSKERQAASISKT